MDPNTNTNQNIPVQNTTNQVPVVTPVVTVPQVEPVNPFLDNLNLNKYDDLLADFELKNPDLAAKAKQSMQNDQSVTLIDTVLPVVNQVPVIEPVQLEPVVPLQEVVPQTIPVQLPPEPVQMAQQVAQQVPVTEPVALEPMAPVQQVVPQMNLQDLPQEPVQAQQTDTGVPVPQLDPTILTQSFQQFPKGSENIQTSTKANPEFAPASPDTGNEKKVEKIVEELKSIEASPEETNEKIQKPPTGSQPNVDEKTLEQQKKEASQIEKIKVYGYQIPQKILELGSKVNDLAMRGDLGSAKTWLYILVGRVIATKNSSKNKDLEV